MEKLETSENKLSTKTEMGYDSVENPTDCCASDTGILDFAVPCELQDITAETSLQEESGGSCATPHKSQLKNSRILKVDDATAEKYLMRYIHLYEETSLQEESGGSCASPHKSQLKNSRILKVDDATAEKYLMRYIHLYESLRKNEHNFPALSATTFQSEAVDSCDNNNAECSSPSQVMNPSQREEPGCSLRPVDQLSSVISRLHRTLNRKRKRMFPHISLKSKLKHELSLMIDLCHQARNKSNAEYLSCSVHMKTNQDSSQAVASTELDLQHQLFDFSP